jgi:hypothetical protein
VSLPLTCLALQEKKAKKSKDEDEGDVKKAKKAKKGDAAPKAASGDVAGAIRRARGGDFVYVEHAEVQAMTDAVRHPTHDSTALWSPRPKPCINTAGAVAEGRIY